MDTQSARTSLQHHAERVSDQEESTPASSARARCGVVAGQHRDLFAGGVHSRRRCRVTGFRCHSPIVITRLSRPGQFAAADLARVSASDPARRAESSRSRAGLRRSASLMERRMSNFAPSSCSARLRSSRNLSCPVVYSAWAHEISDRFSCMVGSSRRRWRRKRPPDRGSTFSVQPVSTTSARRETLAERRRNR